ncbi:MAG: hypothetical protein GX097_09495 [Methanomicrobiales archaeon]|nr:hypothetical protein [Methanomicrobiales archaeon]
MFKTKRIVTGPLSPTGVSRGPATNPRHSVCGNATRAYQRSLTNTPGTCCGGDTLLLSELYLCEGEGI